MEKFEKLKKFRDLDSLKLINKDKSTERLNEKFKDLQEIYTLITNDIKTNSKNWIYSQKDDMEYKNYSKLQYHIFDHLHNSTKNIHRYL